MKNNKKSKNKTRTIVITLIVILLVAVVLLSTLFLLFYYRNALSLSAGGDADNANSSAELEDNEEKYKVTAPDAEEYYEDNSEIISKTAVKDSKDITDEKETIELLNTRGFEDCIIVSDYSVDGEYNEATVIDESSDEKHPAYQTYYLTENEDLWMLAVINGKIMATPISYNAQHEQDVPVMLSESDTVTSYDSATNMFFETIPDDSYLSLKQVKKIDVKTLEKLTAEEIEKL